MLNILRKSGKSIPILDAKPTIDAVVDYYFTAYSRLMTVNASEGVTFSAMKDYAECFGLIGDFDEFVDVIKAVDAAVFEHRSKTQNG